MVRYSQPLIGASHCAMAADVAMWNSLTLSEVWIRLDLIYNLSPG